MSSEQRELLERAPNPASEHVGDRDYLQAGDEFYSRQQLSLPRYATPYPNAEEAARAGAVIGYVARVVERFTLRGDRPRILEVGCGRGWLTNLLSEFGPAEGLDPATGVIAMARRYFPDVTFHQGTTGDLIARDGFRPFDLVVSSEVIEHIPWSHKEEFLAELRSALVGDGICILTTPRREVFHALNRTTIKSRQPVEDWLSERQLWALAARHGFRVVDHTRAYYRRMGFISQIALSSRLRRFLETTGLAALRAAFEYRYCQYQVVVLQKESLRASSAGRTGGPGVREALSEAPPTPAGDGKTSEPL